MTPPHFYIFVIISPLKRTWPRFGHIHFPLQKENKDNNNKKKKKVILLKIFCVFLLFCYYLPFERGNPLHLNKL
jgi:hypothetical protein